MSEYPKLLLRGGTQCILTALCVAVLVGAQETSVSDALLERSPELTSADEIIGTLQRNTDLLLQVKNALVQRAREQGAQLNPADLPDTSLFRMIREEPHVRTLAKREIENYASAQLTAPDWQGSGDPVVPVRPGFCDKAQCSSPAMPAVPNRAPSTSSRFPPPGERKLTTTQERAQTFDSDQNLAITQPRPNPYPYLPSTRDLYQQFPGQGAPLQRFGAEIFRNGTGNAEVLPMDLPAGPDYVLGPGDGLNINLWGSVSQKITVFVDRGGRVSLPESGSIVVAGQTLAKAQEMIQGALASQFKKVRIDVSLTRIRTVRMYVVGDVERPGAYDVSSLSTVLNALYVAGGPTSQGSLRVVRHYRGPLLVREVDLYDLILNGIRKDVERIEPGDTILVPPVGPQVAISGMVKRPAVYELRRETALLDAIELAGGMLVSAALQRIKVERIEAHQRRIMLSVDVPEGADSGGAALRQALGKFQIQDGDRVAVSPILPYSETTIYLQGHVFRPGKFSFHQGMQLSEVIRSYQDLLPEPAEHAEIVRLTPPDYRPRTIEFRLSEVLNQDDPIELQPFDTIRIFGRYEIDPPNVAIYGEVLRPGEYPLSEGMTAAALVRMAGGFRRSAATQQADITSYETRNGEQVVAKHASIRIGQALTDPSLDVVLKPRDVLTVRQLAGWNDVGTFAVVSGEVWYPGTYGIEDGEKLSDLLKRAGGFRNTAYPEGAVLERVQVREVSEKSRQQLIRRIEGGGSNAQFSATTTGQDRAALMQAISQQQEHVLTALRAQPASGRLVIKISSDISKWQNTPSDIELRAGDEITIPKIPAFVLISGQVYNSAALTYTPGKNAAWYLRQAGGPTEMANKKDVYIIRANGSVVGRGSNSWWGGNVLSAAMRRGDTLVVPEKIIGGSRLWKNLLDTAQLTSSVAIAAHVATSF